MIIAEIGINHNGDVNIAKQLIDMSVKCGASAVKFQMRTVDLVYTKEFLEQPRQSPWGNTQRDQKKGLEFSAEDYLEIDNYCKGKIDWFASCWDKQSQKLLRSFKVRYNKIASPMITNLDHLRFVASEGKMTFISTGCAIGTNIDNAVAIFTGYDCPFILMHTVNKYPCPDNLCQLKEINKLKEKYNCTVGYSNHNSSVLAPVLAKALGAEAIEVHITLDRTMYGSDQSASFEEEGLRRIVRECHRIKEIIG